MNTLTFTFILGTVIMAILIGWSYTKRGKKWLKDL